jgi:WD40 repeat protein
MKIINIKGHDVMLDDEDVNFVQSHKWQIDSAWKRGKIYFFYNDHYYKEDGKRTTYHKFLHRLLMGTPVGLVTDHIDGNTLNCQKSNMRICTQDENNKNIKMPNTNTSGYKGVSWHKGHKKWRADIHVDGHQVSLGIYDDPKKAYEVYCAAKKKYHGPYGRVD